MRNKLGSNLGAGAFLLVALVAISPAVAQDDDTKSDGGVRFMIEVDAWGAQPRGLEYEPATLADPTGTTGDSLIEFKQDPSTTPYWRFDLDAGQDVGHFRLTWFTQDQDQTMKEFTPGEFWFGQIQSHPYGAGWLNDGRSDGFEAATSTKISDFRFDFSRSAFRSDNFEGRWLVGIRRVEHDRSMDTVYYALAPLQDPLIPPVFELPRPDLDPQPDEALVSSKYRGRGLEAGMEFDFSFVQDRIKLEAGFAVGVLSGRVDTAYSSRNWVYIFKDPATGEESVLAPPYNWSEQLPSPPPQGSTVADNTTQESVTFRMNTNSRSTISPVMDLYLGLRGRIWKGLEAVLGYRSVFYGNVGVDLRPKVTSITSAGVNFVDEDETERSAEYDGFYLGLAYTF
jgi:hypothetical protein